MKSKFSYRTYIFVGMIIPFTILPIHLFFNRIEAFGPHYNFKFLFVGTLSVLASLYLILGTISRVVFFKMTNEEVIVKKMVQPELRIKLEDLDGYETTIETSRGGNYEVIYLMKNRKSLVHISEFHIANYKELKNEIEKNLKNLGYKQFSFFSDWKRYF